MILYIILETMKFWKEDPYEGFEYIPVIILAAVLLLSIVYFGFKHYKTNVDYWHGFLNYGLHKSLNPHGLIILENFYKQLTEKEKRSLMGSRKLFYKKIFLYLSETNDIPYSESIEMLARLFPHPSSQRKVAKLKDLQIGEVVYLDNGSIKSLGSVAEYSPDADKDMIHIFSKNPTIFETNKESTIKLFAYRPGLGSYSIEVELLQTNENTIKINFIGNIEFRSEAHLSADIEFLLRIYPVLSPDEEMKLLEPVKNQDGEISNEPIELFLDGQANNLSVNSITLDLDDRTKIRYDRRREQWDLVFDSPLTTEVLTIRGSMFPVPGSKSKFLFKFIDIDKDYKDKIIDIITNTNPKTITV